MREAGPSMQAPVTVIGASGRSGAALCRALLGAGRAIVPVVRDPSKWLAAGISVEPRVADLTEPESLRLALADAALVVSCAHARHVPTILAASPAAQRFVFLGSTRKFTRWPDAHGNGVLAGEAAFRAAGRPGVMLHPTMIYGAEGEDNVRRLAAALRRLPFAPLPGGGRALIQPIHQDDLTACILAAADVPWAEPETLIVAGPHPVAYADFVRAIAAATGRRVPPIVAVPASVLMAAARLTAYLPFLPRIQPAEIRRLLEDKAFDIGPMLARLNVTPRPLEAGLAATFASAHGA